MTPGTVDPRSVFVVHGRNEGLRRSIFDFLRSINLAPMEWSRAVELTGEGSPYIGQVLESAFDNATAVVVLMTPDEVAYLQPRYGSGDADPETQPKPQARPNVLFEAGMALGRDPRRTVLVEVGEVRPFSDVAGRHAVRLTNEISTRQELANRLKNAGCAVDLRGNDWHTTGDFTAPTAPGGGQPLGRRVPSAPPNLKPVDFDLKYINKGGNKIDKLQVINRGTDDVYEVSVSFPHNAALNPVTPRLIDKIPGGGRSVTIDVINYYRMMGGDAAQRSPAFDATVSGRSEAGEMVTQEVFIDVNG